MSFSLDLDVEMAESRLVKVYNIQLPERMGEMLLRGWRWR